jgi:hypothetical protein
MLTPVNPEQRVPANHPIRLDKALAEIASAIDCSLATLSSRGDAETSA